jgi:hypothetical protein
MVKKNVKQIPKKESNEKKPTSTVLIEKSKFRFHVHDPLKKGGMVEKQLEQISAIPNPILEKNKTKKTPSPSGKKEQITFPENHPPQPNKEILPPQENEEDLKRIYAELAVKLALIESRLKQQAN